MINVIIYCFLYRIFLLFNAHYIFKIGHLMQEGGIRPFTFLKDKGKKLFLREGEKFFSCNLFVDGNFKGKNVNK